MDERIIADLIGRKRWEATIPERYGLLLRSHPAFEAAAIGRPFENKEARRRKAFPIAPRAGHPVIGARNEIFEIALPTAIKIGVESRDICSGQTPPTRIMDRPHIMDEAGAKLRLDQNANCPQNKGVSELPELASL